MVKRDLAPFLGSKSPYAMFSIKKSPEQLEDAAWAAGREGGFHSQLREWQTVPINSMQGTSVW